MSLDDHLLGEASYPLKRVDVLRETVEELEVSP